MAVDQFFKIRSIIHVNLVQAFYSNARIKHDEFGETVVAINSFLLNTPIRLTLQNFGEFFKLPPRGELDEKGHYNLALQAQLSFAFYCYLDIALISKHVILRSTDSWCIDSFHNNMHLDLALILFNDIIKRIGQKLKGKLFNLI
ncbi:hypothetical protein PVK06_043618 [Gossypium arboreum]|uniref:Uncharacterized protein n=1 Tax=Gossypium arboreum TaxID=29729 RepID=A0ABR0MP08_GOSAR|nr:hypothetical protein PVK06_043618 [Gossypium arboreum]